MRDSKPLWSGEEKQGLFAGAQVLLVDALRLELLPSKNLTVNCPFRQVINQARQEWGIQLGRTLLQLYPQTVHRNKIPHTSAISNSVLQHCVSGRHLPLLFSKALILRKTELLLSAGRPGETCQLGYALLKNCKSICLCVYQGWRSFKSCRF